MSGWTRQSCVRRTTFILETINEESLTSATALGKVYGPCRINCLLNMVVVLKDSSVAAVKIEEWIRGNGDD